MVGATGGDGLECDWNSAANCSEKYSSSSSCLSNYCNFVFDVFSE